MEKLIGLLAEFPNLGAVAFGFAGIIVTGFFGWLIKRPLERQKVSNEVFNTIVENYDALVKTQAARITQLESHVQSHEAHELDLLNRIRRLEHSGHTGYMPSREEENDDR